MVLPLALTMVAVAVVSSVAQGGMTVATKKLTRQQEIDKSIDSGTVPSRYRSQVPKQYQQYVPFDKQ